MAVVGIFANSEPPPSQVVDRINPFLPDILINTGTDDKDVIVRVVRSLFPNSMWVLEDE